MMNFFIRLGSIVEPEYRKRKNKNVILSGIYLCILCVVHIQRIFKSFMGRYIVVPRLEIAITSRCSLKCKNCVSLMQYYSNPFDVDIDLNLLSLRKILDSVDQVNQLKILGGEPFINKDLHKIINEASRHENVKAIWIITNGTIVPKGEVLINSLRNNKVEVRISYYGDNSRNAERIKELCKKENISCFVKFEEEMWQSPGGLEKRNKTEKQLKKQYMRCPASLCNNLLGGKLHHCSRSSNGMNIGMIPDESTDYLDVMQEISRDEFRKKINDFMYHDRGYIAACDYCDLSTDKSYDVIPGEQ